MNEKVELLKYYDVVRYCACYGNSFNSERGEMIEQTIVFNTVLPSTYKITIKEDKDFFDFYKKYRDNLMKKYLDPYCCFNIPNYLSKKTSSSQFKELYGQISHTVLFLAYTFYNFAQEILRDESNEEIPIVAYKMYLSTILILTMLGETCIEYKIKNTEDIIDFLQNKKKE